MRAVQSDGIRHSKRHGGSGRRGQNRLEEVTEFGKFFPVILSFACKETEKIFTGRRSRKLPADIQNRARRKLIQLENSQILNDMRIPPSNRLEALSGDLAGFWSVRVNQQWRLIFQWREGSASEVQIIDYH